MKFGIEAFLAAIVFVGTGAQLYGQSSPSAIQESQLSVFAGATGTDTTLAGGNNVGVTAGFDLGIRRFQTYLPSIEVRGSYPFYKGDTAAAYYGLGGVKVERRFGRFHPYGDVLIGRAEIDYKSPGFPNPQQTFRYTQSPSTVYDFGGGVDFDMTYHLALKADAQWQHYSVPVTLSGTVTPVPVTVGVVYRFDFTKLTTVAHHK